MEGEAKRLAVVVRVLVHDTANSRSLLSQLGVKNVLNFTDTAQPINPRNLAPTEGLVIMRIGPTGGAYVAPLGDGPPERYSRTKGFRDWWEQPVSKLSDGRFVSRMQYVLPAANQEGGAHVDPALSPLFDDFVRRNPYGWIWHAEGQSGALAGNGALVSVRQIAFELEETLRPLVS